MDNLFFFLQFQLSGCCVGEFKFERTYLLCDEMTDFMLGMHEYVSMYLYFKSVLNVALS